jgi:hypothetical protein
MSEIAFDEKAGRSQVGSFVFSLDKTIRYGATVNFPELVAVPPAVVMTISPVFAPVGTVAVI